jgi:hypothetical protein
MLWRSHNHHRDFPARLLATLPSRGVHSRDQDRHIMIRSGSRRHSSAAHLLGWLATGQDHARRRATLDNRIVDQSQRRDPGSAYHDPLIAFATPSTASQTAGQCTSAAERQRRNPFSV